MNAIELVHDVCPLGCQAGDCKRRPECEHFRPKLPDHEWHVGANGYPVHIDRNFKIGRRARRAYEAKP